MVLQPRPSPETSIPGLVGEWKANRWAPSYTSTGVSAPPVGGPKSKDQKELKFVVWKNTLTPPPNVVLT
jgi:hypothetical protein